MFRVLKTHEVQINKFKCLKKRKRFLIYPVDSEKENKINDLSEGRWTKVEHKRFIEGIILYGNDWKKIQKHIKTRTSTQARSHAQKFLMKIKRSHLFQNKNIDSNLSWAKTIQCIKKKFTQEELLEILETVSQKTKKKNNNNNQVDIEVSTNNSDDEYIENFNQIFSRKFDDEFDEIDLIYKRKE